MEQEVTTNLGEQDNEVQIEPDVKERLEKAYKKRSEENIRLEKAYNMQAGLSEEGDLEIQEQEIKDGLREINEYKYILTAMHEQIGDFNNCLEMEPKEIDATRELIDEYMMKLNDTTTKLLESADSESLNNPDFLERINVAQINDVYFHKEYDIHGGWLAKIGSEDISKMMEKSGSKNLEFKDCDIFRAFFEKKVENCKFEMCSLSGCKFEDVKFENTTFEKVHLYGCELKNVEFKNCKFEKCSTFHDLSYSDIKFVDTDIKDSTLFLDNTDLDLKSINFKNSSMENVKCLWQREELSQTITKKVNLTQSFKRLLDRNIVKSLNQNTKAQEHAKDKRVRSKGKSR